jgi:predicted transcriptional regulator
MVLSLEKRYEVYYNILRNLENGNYLTLARRGYLSEPGSRLFFKQMEDGGYIIGYKNKENKKFAKITEKGREFINEISPLNRDNFIKQLNKLKSDRGVNDNG